MKFIDIFHDNVLLLIPNKKAIELGNIELPAHIADTLRDPYQEHAIVTLIGDKVTLVEENMLVSFAVRNNHLRFTSDDGTYILVKEAELLCTINE